jgi:molybdopterin-guanine dinucleotide biosynthesis protein A
MPADKVLSSLRQVIRLTIQVPVVILAGGKSRRMGRDKMEMDFGGRPLLESAVERFMGEASEVYISVADPGKYPEVKARRIVDTYPGAGPLSGLHAALSSLTGEGVILVAADLPYSSPQAAARLIELCGENEACVIRLPDGKLEPLFGYYKKTLLPRCLEQISAGDYRMTELIAWADTRYVSPDELGSLWDEKMILNVNSPEDYAAALDA